ncbi:MAG: cytochrome c3 family protein [Bdellovibrionales bacterium]|jgi:hypothetical protein|nr:cytochrome c3 family protein [Bdellovibrionales bacterium]MBT3527056.1 cytochrome c3 family protein [Bdellovibrionales bacterium]MBT7765593.1 cytochrome c3 family protein [Bdellovibrionales bacterium]
MRVIIFVSLFVLMIIGGMGVYSARRTGLNQGFRPTQPIAFSHKEHAGINKMECLYCHFAAEQGRHAGIPPVGVCMNCHKFVKKNDSKEIAKVEQAYNNKKPIEWTKVHYLPDFAYFNHSQHVVVGKIACQTCHGPAETMEVMEQYSELSMGWCIDCHREKGIAPPQDHKAATGGDCSKCHY